MTIAILLIYPLGMAIGQLLFKSAASGWRGGAAGIVGLAFNLSFVGAVALYGVLSVVWVWLLRTVPLSVAYPFFAASFLFTPVLSWLFLGETLSWPYFCGVLLIASGIIVTVRYG
jgi:drug/metabolite transporter (DMT)-like permease